MNHIVCIPYLYIYTCVEVCANLTRANNKAVCKTITNLKKSAESDLATHIEMWFFVGPPQDTKQFSPYQTPAQTLGSCTCNRSETADNRPDIICILILLRAQTSRKWAKGSTQTLQKGYKFQHMCVCFMVAPPCPRSPRFTKTRVRMQSDGREYTCAANCNGIHEACYMLKCKCTIQHQHASVRGTRARGAGKHLSPSRYGSIGFRSLKKPKDPLARHTTAA